MAGCLFSNTNCSKNDISFSGSTIPFIVSILPLQTKPLASAEVTFFIFAHLLHITKFFVASCYAWPSDQLCF